MYILTPERYHLLYVSIIVYIIVNLFENIFYYSIGRHSNQEGIQIEFPTRKDWLKIICVTLIFAVLQGYLTCLFN
jgi:surface polysaccharide O-acyltransferase-like enzyme